MAHLTISHVYIASNVRPAGGGAEIGGRELLLIVCFAFVVDGSCPITLLFVLIELVGLLMVLILDQARACTCVSGANSFCLVSLEKVFATFYHDFLIRFINLTTDRIR